MSDVEHLRAFQKGTQISDDLTGVLARSGFKKEQCLIIAMTWLWGFAKRCGMDRKEAVDKFNELSAATEEQLSKILIEGTKQS
jgi:hypothetical protein